MVEGLKNLDEGFIPPGLHRQRRLFTARPEPGRGSPRESIEWTRRLADVGIFAGHLVRGRMAGVARCASEIDEGTSSPCLRDGGWKYLSTDVWAEDLDDVVERARHELYF